MTLTSCIAGIRFQLLVKQPAFLFPGEIVVLLLIVSALESVERMVQSAKQASAGKIHICMCTKRSEKGVRVDDRDACHSRRNEINGRCADRAFPLGGATAF